MSIADSVLYYLWVAPHVFLAAIPILLLRHGSFRVFPVFFAYSLFEIFQFCVLFSIARWAMGPKYAVAWGIGLAISTAFRFAIVYEVFGHLFRSYPVAKRFGTILFRGITAVLLLGGLFLAAYAGGHRADPWWFATHVFDRTASILQCGLLVGLFVFSGYFGLSWRNNVFGIALGMGVLASVELASAAITSATGLVYGTYLDFLRMGTYHVCVVAWIFYLWRPEPTTDALGQVPEHRDLENWGDELQELAQR